MNRKPIETRTDLPLSLNEAAGEPAKNTLAYVSNTVVGTGNNFIRRWPGPGTLTFRSYYQVKETGDFSWRFWFSNTVDSTFAMGEQAWANRTGGSWLIKAANIAVSGRADGSIQPESRRPISFSGKRSKSVAPDERFWSDVSTLTVLPGQYLVFTWSVSVDQAGDWLPYSMDSQIPAFLASGDQAEAVSGDLFTYDLDCAKPSLLAVARPVAKRIAFIGDSITQGCGTRTDLYESWAARIGMNIGSEYAVWNLGLGYARAADAATDGAWLDKAKQCDEVNICLGVNDLLHESRDAAAILADLQKIVSILKQSGVTGIILMTVPPFNFTGNQEKNWRRINQLIRTGPPSGVDRVFDIAAVLSRPAPDEQISRFDPHPDGQGGAEIADAYLKWY